MKGKVLNIPKGETGLPCKSYVHILNLDIELKRFLSYIAQNEYFNQYIINGITYYYRYKDRKEAVDEYMAFMATCGVDRIDFVFPSRMFNRTLCIQLLNSMYDGIRKYKHIQKAIKKNHAVSDDDMFFYNVFYQRWLRACGNQSVFMKQVAQAHSRVNKLIDDLIYYYQSYIIKYLLKNRRGDKDPKHLRTDAYNLIMTLINVYDYKKSKIPFHNILRPYISNYKNKIIQYETWGNNPMISLDTGEADDDVSTDSIGSFTSSIGSSIWGEVERKLYHEKRQDDKAQLVELAYQSLPRPLQEVASLNYEIIDPLPFKQELLIALSSYNKKPTSGNKMYT